MFFMFFQQQEGSNQDTPQEVDLNPAMALERLDSWLDGFVKLLPNIGVAIIVVIIFYILARVVRGILYKWLKGRGRENLGAMLSGLTKYSIIILGFLLAATIILPTLKPGDLIAGLGVSSVAIGFAFKDILQNWLAGLLILLRQPFEVGDQIVVGDFEGTVDRIETRATIITRYSGEQIVIPNGEIYTNAVKVNTANDIIRSQYDVGIGYADDIEEARDLIRETVSQIEGVNKENGIDVLTWGLDASWVTLRVRWWTNSPRADVVKVWDKVIMSIKYALDEAKIDMPYDTKVHLMHDQTEESDGDRSAQREGWPDDGESEGTTPKWKAERAEDQKKEKEEKADN